MIFPTVSTWVAFEEVFGALDRVRSACGRGEALGLHWEDVDLDAGYVRIRKNRLRPKYAHGCGAEPCGRKAGYCPKREQTRREHKSTKSRAGRRTIGLPDPLIKILHQHREAQERERIAAGVDWEGKGYVFASPTGGPLSPNTDFHVWKRLLRDAGVRGEPGGAARMRARYMHVTGVMLRKVAQQSVTRSGRRPPLRKRPTETETETGNVEGPHCEQWGPSTSCPVRHWRRIRDSNS